MTGKKEDELYMLIKLAEDMNKKIDFIIEEIKEINNK